MKSLNLTGLLTVRDVAQRLRIGTRTVWKWTSDGHLPAPLRFGKSGRTVRWQATDIDRFLAELAPLRPTLGDHLWDYMSGDQLRASE